ncbi:DNA methyltransferase [Leptospira gomenensis]|uniref:DNA methyltransferase n=1 Tax=Leptospira gomenensis TaxID=2484974 RepID=A0A5F1Y9M4_9LEPT|nr:RsmD family RNA methyltransferase [Leptospira gomenensis]TGK31816.1 DNA methyltransferase [Leptospira gomenensis]TGK34772.1 DNA methyltransferase [Leptospira gomenensis]TGK41557.1 DNA methyltransferase [Leptospira gomenensis]TGK61485.1 DNA methyltransferase [Leptospira gomenensis]
MKSLKVQTGKLKGKSIETPPAVAGNTNFTPAIVKKSLFDVIGSLVLKGRLIPEESVFVDFFAGSGQIALEAVSRGFARVVLYELAWERSDTLRKLFDKIGGTHDVFRKDVFRFYDKLDVPEKSRVYFLDPPYSFWEKKNEKFRVLSEDLLSKEATTAVFVQSPVHPGWENYETRKFGKNFLSFRIRENSEPFVPFEPEKVEGGFAHEEKEVNAQPSETDRSESV